MEHKAARNVSMGLGAWLLFSAFLWPHSLARFLISAFVGAVVVSSAPLASTRPAVWRLNAALGVLLATAGFMLPRVSGQTTWHNVLIGLAITLTSLMGLREAAPLGPRWNVARLRPHLHGRHLRLRRHNARAR